MKRALLLTTIYLFLSVLTAYGQRQSTVRTFSVRDGLPANSITSVRQDHRGLIWIATWNGLCCYDGYQFTTFRGEPWSDNALSTNRLSAIEPDSADNILLRTYDGHIYRLDTRTSQYVHEGKLQVNSHYGWEHVFFDSHVSNNGVKEMTDRQGNLWQWSSGGLSLTTYKDYRIRLLPIGEETEVRALLPRADGSLWAGTRKGIVAVFDREGHRLGWLDSSGRLSSVMTPFSSSGIYAMAEDREGNVWIGTKGDGLYVVADGKVCGHYLHDFSDRYSLLCDDIYAIDEDTHGNLWIATWGGGVQLVTHAEVQNARDGRLHFLHRGNDLKGYPHDGFEKVRRITHDSRGTLLASTTSGLLTWSSGSSVPKHFYTTRHLNTDTTSLQTDDVAQTLVTRQGVVYVVTMGGGVQRIATDQLLANQLPLQRVAAMNKGEGSAMSLVEDHRGNIWITRESEINRFVTATGTLEQYGPNSMPAYCDLTEAQSVAAADGNIYAGGAACVLMLHPDSMTKSRYVPNIVFTDVRYQGEQQEMPLLNRPLLDIQDKPHRDFTIRFAALDYESNYLLEYAYKMDDGDQWNYIGRTPSISFSQLSPGRHVLTVKSTNADGVWCENAATIMVYVQPTLWERGWFRALIILLVIGLTTWAILRYLRYRQHAAEREQRLESIMRQYRELQESIAVNPEPQTVTHEPSAKYTLSEPEVVNPDEEMMSQLMAYIEQRIGDEQLRVEDMADAVGMGRTVFFGKLKEIVGLSPSDFLKQVRMQRAEQLVRRSRLTFSEIAYSVGFTDPKYFTKCFKKQTGMTPSEYRQKESATH